MDPTSLVQQWRQWNQDGFFPGPQETEESFIKRIEYCQRLDSHLTYAADSSFSADSPRTTLCHWGREAFELTQSLYGIAPSWVPVIFDDSHLAPWHGGCAWIFQMAPDEPVASLLQVRSRFQTASTYIGLLRREELVAHELAHVSRMSYDSPRFEEFFAYASSHSHWRRWWGPIVQSSRESLIFIASLGVMTATDLASLVWPSPLLTVFAWGAKGIVLLLLFTAITRLMWRHAILKQCEQHLLPLYPTSLQARHLMYRLTDDEIIAFSRWHSLHIATWIQTQSTLSFRWRFLSSLYPPFVQERKEWIKPFSAKAGEVPCEVMHEGIQ